MTVSRVSQVAVEALRTNTGVKARVSQVAVEALRTSTSVDARVSQVAVEVLRQTVPEVFPTGHEIVQYVADAAAGGVTSGKTLSAAPTVGNLLIAFVFFGSASEASMVVASGWFVVDKAMDPGTDPNICGLALGRYVESGDTATMPAFLSSSGATYHAWTVYEIAGVTGDWSIDFFASSAMQQAGITSAYSGRPRRVTVPNVLALCGFAKYGENSPVATTPAGWTTDVNAAKYIEFGAYGCAHKAASAGDDVSASFNSSSAGSNPASIMQVLLAVERPTVPTVTRTRVFLRGTGAVTAMQFGRPKTDDLILHYLFLGSGSDAKPAINTADWTEFASQNGATHPMLLGLQRQITSMASDTLPEVVSAALSTYTASVVVELSGVDDGFLANHVETTSGHKAPAAAGPDITTAATSPGDDCVGIVVHASYNTSSMPTTTGCDVLIPYAGNTVPYGAVQLGITYLDDAEVLQSSHSQPASSIRRVFAQSMFGLSAGDPVQSVFKLNSYSVSGAYLNAISVPKLISYVVAETEVISVFKLDSYSITSQFSPSSVGLSKVDAFAVTTPWPQTAEAISKFASYLVTYPQALPVVTKVLMQSVLGSPLNAVSIHKLTAYVVKRPAPPPDPVTATYPESLPNPRVADISATERRRLPQTSTTFEATARSRDRISRQNLTWTLRPDQAEIFDEWWQTDLEFGGMWFTASWPSPRGFIAIDRKFIEAPRWTHIGNGTFEVSVTCEVRDIKVH